MSLSIEFRRVANVRTYDLVDYNGRRDPLAGWKVDMNSPDRDIKDVYCKNGNLNDIWIESKKHGLLPKKKYEKTIGVYFRVSGTMT